MDLLQEVSLARESSSNGLISYHMRNLEVGEILWFTLRYVTYDATLTESVVDPPSTAGKRTSNFSIVADFNCTWNDLPPYLPWANPQGENLPRQIWQRSGSDDGWGLLWRPSFLGFTRQTRPLRIGWGRSPRWCQQRSCWGTACLACGVKVIWCKTTDRCSS